MEYLEKLNRDWATFMFLSGYEVDVLTPKKTPKSKTNPFSKNDEPIPEAEDGYEGEMQPIIEPMEVEMENLQKKEIPQPKTTRNKPKPNKKGHGRITRSQTVGKGNLEDILQAIDTEETTVVKPVEAKVGKKKNKGLTAKKLEFSSEDASFLFKPRKLIIILKLSKGIKVDQKHEDVEKEKQPMVK